MRALRRLFSMIAAAHPALRVGQGCPAMFSVVAAIAEFELIVIPCKFQRSGHLLVRERPTAVQVIQIIRAILQKNANRLLWRSPNDRGINVSTANIREAADVAQDFAKRICPFPSNSPGANSARTNAANRPTF